MDYIQEFITSLDTKEANCFGVSDWIDFIANRESIDFALLISACEVSHKDIGPRLKNLLLTTVQFLEQCSNIEPSRANYTQKAFDFLQELQTGSSLTSYTTLTLRMWLKLLKSHDRPEQDSMESSSTKKRKVQKKDTSTSTIAAPILDRSADVLESDQSSESESDLSEPDEKYFQSTNSVKTGGITGCDISVQRDDGSWRFVSEKLPLTAKYLDLKLYPSTKEIRYKTPLELWKSANYRAKIAIPPKEKAILKTIRTLQNQLLDLAERSPGLKKSCAQDTKRK